MDQPCAFAEWLAIIRDVDRIHRAVAGVWPTLRFVRQAARRHRETAGVAPLRVLDIGFGSGSILRQLASWGARAGVPLALEGIDMNPHAAAAAQQLTAAAIERAPSERERAALQAISFRTGDVTASSDVYDVVISTLVMHHLEYAEIVSLLGWTEAHTRVGWHVNDLRRQRWAAAAYALLCALLRIHPTVAHDGVVSIRRSFRPADWKRLLQKSSIRFHTVRMSGSVPGHLCLSRLR